MGAFLLQDYRCPYCDKLLLRGNLFLGAVEVKCKRCGKVVKLHAFDAPSDGSGYTIIVDLTNVIVGVSKEISSFLDYLPQELLGRKITMLDPMLKLDGAITAFTELGINNSLEIDTSHYIKGGGRLLLRVAIRLIGTRHGMFVLLTCRLAASESAKRAFGMSDRIFSEPTKRI